MTGPPVQACPGCGAAAQSGNFCSACGTSLGATRCRGCAAQMPAGARFCANCGKSAHAVVTPAVAGAGASFWFYALGGAAVLGIILMALVRGAPTAPAEIAAAGPGPVAEGEPPDISAMSPRERFDRLYNRIMRAAESGDEATVSRFTPMALMAYAQLPDIDADARYHAALLKVHTGDGAGARALGDTILRQAPNHLFGYMVRGTVARWQKDEKALARAYADFLLHHDAETKAGRSEYGEHSRALADFQAAALAAKGTQ